MKNRDNIYLVVRDDPEGCGVAVCSSYASLEAADEAASRENQRWKDRGWITEDIFVIWTTTFYDQ